MAEPQMVPTEPRAPSAAQPDQGGVSQDQAQGVADSISKAMGTILDQMKKVLDSLKVMGIDNDVLSKAADAGDEFVKEVQEALGLKPEDQPGPEGGSEDQGGGAVPMESGGNGQPAQ